MRAQTQNIEKQKAKDAVSWRTLTLGEVGEIVSGGTPSTAVSEYWGGDINWISPSDLTGYKKKTIKKGAKSITKIGLKNSSARLMPKGSVLFSSRAPIGYVVIAAENLCTNQGFKSIIPHEFITSEYLYYYLSASKQLEEEVASGTIFKEISKTKFAELPIPVPDLETQNRIVSKIKELFSELDKGIENLKLAHEQLKMYRQSVLKLAFEGRLTNEDVKEGELPEGWKLTKLSEASELITKGASPKWQGINYVDDSSQVLFITSENVRENYIDISFPKYLELEFNKKQKRSILRKGDILLNIVGASIGRAAIFDLEENANINQAVCVIRTSNNVVNKYLSHFLNSNSAFRYYNLNKVDVARAILSLQDIGNIDFNLPSKDEQFRILSEIDSRISLVDKMEKDIIQILHQTETMRQSILSHAFDGLLTESTNKQNSYKFKI